MTGRDRLPLTVGLLVRRVDLNDYDRELWKVAFDKAKERRCNLLLIAGHSSFAPDRTDATYSALYSMLNPGLVDGCILSQTVALWLSADEIAQFSRELPSLPLVSTSIQFGNHPVVWVDNVSGLRALMRHLIGTHGCRRIVHVRGPRLNREAQLREDVWREELLAAGVTPEPEWLVQGHFWRQELLDIGTKILDQTQGEFDAVVACNDTAAFRVIEDLQSCGYRVPEDYRVCGFDDTDRAQYSLPTLTTVRQPMDKLLKQCWSGLEAFVRTGKAPANRSVATALVVRGSCGCQRPGPGHETVDVGGLVSSHRREVAGLLDKVQKSTEFDRAMNQVTSLEELRSVLLDWLPRIGVLRFAIFRSCNSDGVPSPFVSHRDPGHALVAGPEAFQPFASWPCVLPAQPPAIRSSQLSVAPWFPDTEPYVVGVFPLVVGDTWHGMAFLELSRDAGLWERSVQEQVASVFHRLDLERRHLEEQTRVRLKTEQLEAQEQLVSEVAHEINTPLGAILSSSAAMESTLRSVMERSAGFFLSLTPEGRDLYLRLMASRPAGTAKLPLRHARRRQGNLARFLASRGLSDAIRTAEGLVSLGWEGGESDLEDMAAVTGFEAVVDYVSAMDDMVTSSWVIAAAAEKASDFVAKLVTGTQTELRDRKN